MIYSFETSKNIVILSYRGLTKIAGRNEKDFRDIWIWDTLALDAKLTNYTDAKFLNVFNTKYKNFTLFFLK